MAFPTDTYSQIIDSITQSGTTILGNSPAVAMANVYQSMAQAICMAAHNATSAQQHTNITAQASTIQGVVTLHGMNGVATRPIFA